jgi:hydroxyquinol 1,2-dioxygenase
MSYANLQNITELSASRWQDLSKDPRTAQLMSSLVRHLHEFARENKLTMEEWFETTEWLSRTGQITNDTRKEFILLSDVLGLSMMLELLHDSKPSEATQNTLLGPFYIPGSAAIPYGARLPGIGDDDGTPLILSGTVRGLDGEPIAGAVIDVWQNDHNGIYEAQMPAGSPVLCRAVQHSRADGSYMFRTVMPVDYSIPTDGPVGELFAKTYISDVRPAHIHFKVGAEGHPTLVTHIFDRQSTRLESDPVFGARDGLLVDFIEHPAGTAPNGDVIDRPYRVATLDFALV